MLFQRRKHTARRRWRLSVKLLIASSVATVIGFSAICASVMLDMRRGEEQLARQMLENLASGIDADIGRNIELYDLSLRAVASNMVMPETQGRQQADPAPDPVRSRRHRKAFRRDPGVRRDRTVDDRRVLARSAAGEPRRRGVFHGSSRQSQCGAVHQQADAAPGRLFDRAEPAHHRRTTAISSAWSRARSASPISTSCSTG